MLEKIADSNWLPLWSRSSQDEGIDIISTNKDEIISDINTVGIIFLISLDRPYFITYVHMNASPCGYRHKFWQSLNLLQNLIFDCDAPPELLYSYLLSNRDLDGLTKDILSRTKASLCLTG